MIILHAFIGLFLGTMIAFVSHKATGGFGEPQNQQAITATGWSFAIGILLWAFYVRFLISSEIIVFLLLATVIIGVLATIYTRNAGITVGHSVAVALAKVGLLSFAGVLISYVFAGDTYFWFAYGFSCALTFLFLELYTPSP